MTMEKVYSKSYTLTDKGGHWLGQVVLTSDGMFASVTDYGNLSYAWRSTGDTDFRKFMSEINTGYFATKLYTGLSYIVYSKKVEAACNRFSEKILPALQLVLKAEIESDIPW